MVRGAVPMCEDARMGMCGEVGGVLRGRRWVRMPSTARRVETILRIAAWLGE